MLLDQLMSQIETHLKQEYLRIQQDLLYDSLSETKDKVIRIGSFISLWVAVLL